MRSLDWYFLHLDECPYCVKMLNDNFVEDERRKYIQKHFDVIGVNIRGATELVWVDGSSYIERALAADTIRHVSGNGAPHGSRYAKTLCKWYFS